MKSRYRRRCLWLSGVSDIIVLVGLIGLSAASVALGCENFVCWVSFSVFFSLVKRIMVIYFFSFQTFFSLVTQLRSCAPSFHLLHLSISNLHFIRPTPPHSLLRHSSTCMQRAEAVHITQSTPVMLPVAGILLFSLCLLGLRLVLDEKACGGQG